MNYICYKCKFIFNRLGETDNCPQCGSINIIKEKYNDEESDENIKLIAIHRYNTANLSLSESDRHKSMLWLIERGYTHYADDLVKKDIERITLQ